LPFWAVERSRRVHGYIDSAQSIAEAHARRIGSCDGQCDHSGLQLRKHYCGGANSVLNQTFSKYEIIIVNDGSTDTALLEHALEPFRQRMHYIHQENQGPSGARNAGILAARGRYVAFLDSDDRWLPGHLASQIALLEKRPSLALVYADAMLTVDDIPVRTYFESCPQIRPVTFESLVKEESSVITSATVALREALITAGMFDKQFRRCEDFDLWTRVAHCGYEVDYTSQVQIVHRSRHGLSADTECMKRSLIAVYEKMASTLRVSEAQKDLILSQRARADAELQLELCRKHLLSGETRQALVAAQAARIVFHNWKMRLVVLALHVAPRPLAMMYRIYARYLARRNRNRLKRLRIGMHSGSQISASVPGITTRTVSFGPDVAKTQPRDEQVAAIRSGVRGE
jgi:glycosyltransferase involved in cell wall biosynthesis